MKIQQVDERRHNLCHIDIFIFFPSMKKQHCFSLPGLSFLQTGLKWRKHSIWELNWEPSPRARETFPWAFSFSAEQPCTELPAATPREKLQVQCISCINSCSSAPQGRDRPSTPLTQGFTACVAGALAAVAVQGGELLVRFAQFADAAARGQARRLPPIGVASTWQPPLGIAVNIKILQDKLKKENQITITLGSSLVRKMLL